MKRFVFFAMLLAGCGPTTNSSPSGVTGVTGVTAAAAARAPSEPLQFRLLSGEAWAAPVGKVLVVDIWASYCKPCRKGFPKLDALRAAQPDIELLAVSVDEKDAAAQQFLTEVPTKVTIGRASADWVMGAPLKLHSVPSLLVFDKQGRERFRASEAFDADYDKLPAIVQQLLAE